MDFHIQGFLYHQLYLVFQVYPTKAETSLPSYHRLLMCLPLYAIVQSYGSQEVHRSYHSWMLELPYLVESASSIEVLPKPNRIRNSFYSPTITQYVTQYTIWYLISRMSYYVSNVHCNLQLLLLISTISSSNVLSSSE